MKLQWALILFVICGCAPMRGTGTGNPSNSNSGASEPMQLASVQTYVAICQKLDTCHAQADATECRAFINAQTSFAVLLGINSVPAPTSHTIMRQEESRQLTADWTAATICQVRIEALTCGDAVVQAAFVSGAPDPYAAAANLLAPDCKGVFGP